MSTKSKQTIAHQGIFRLLTVFFVLSFSGFLLSYAASHTLLNETFTQQILRQPANQKIVNKEVRQLITQAASDNGLPSQVTANLIDDATIQKVVSGTVKNLFANQTDPVPTNLIVTDVQKKVNTALQQYIGITSPNLVAQVTDTLKTYLDDNIQPTANQVGTRVTEIRSVAKIAMVVGAALSIVLAIIMLALSRGRIASWWYLSWGVGFAGLLSTVAAFIFRANSNFSFVAAYSRGFQSIIQQWLTLASNRYKTLGLAILIVGIIFIVVTGFLKGRGARLND